MTYMTAELIIQIGSGGWPNSLPQCPELEADLFRGPSVCCDPLDPDTPTLLGGVLTLSPCK